MNKSSQIMIIGSGILGLTIAKELVEKGFDNILILEKDISCGKHASGRNSGVLHAGIYYANDSLKAEFCLKGNRMMQEYCSNNNLPIYQSGKAIVVKNSSELETLDELHRRAIANGANVELISKNALKKKEPYAKTFDTALWSNSTAVVDPKLILMKLEQDLKDSGRVRFLFNCSFKALHDDNTAVTSQGKMKFDYLINVAGAYADKVMHAFGLGHHLSLLPFKGVYMKLKPSYAKIVNGNIYPVPNIKNPFLGVHFTKSIAGDAYVGPTAIPAFGRENYGILSGIDKDVFSIVKGSLSLFIKNKKFRALALEEPKKYLKYYFFRDAKKLVVDLKKEWLLSTSKVGIRPQLVNWDTGELEMDYVVKNTKTSCHLVNAISPAFTSSMALAQHIVDKKILN